MLPSFQTRRCVCESERHEQTKAQIKVQFEMEAAGSAPFIHYCRSAVQLIRLMNQ